MILIAMGVSGSGKTTVGEQLAARLGCGFADADSFHSDANKQKMHAGIALTDDDRWPWLRAIRADIEQRRAQGVDYVYACSALKASYREILRAGDKDVIFVYLQGTREVLERRLAGRKGHFFDPSLLQSQLDTLEPPGPHEAVVVDIDQDVAHLVDEIVEKAVRHGQGGEGG
ncbi:gluconokinase [Pararobbsia silviterrae]|uniref:Gluconokinase n=1 Tax=Pararobbsia silviterrae TaxID=1792498 RepID=A0A494XG89_9BURK|nr:gluconokinase [Pararobbsia silviterrae]RKP48711.1 gluconokinase [Pararobbsia silviterrae]